jgi:6-phosphofructokinase 2
VGFYFPPAVSSSNFNERNFRRSFNDTMPTSWSSFTTISRLTCSLLMRDKASMASATVTGEDRNPAGPPEFARDARQEMRGESQYRQRSLETISDYLISGWSAESGEAMKSILSLTINPAIDASCSVETVFPDHKLRSSPVYHEAGGGGVNVSRAIRNLGGNSTVFYLAGGPSGQMLGLLLDREGLKHKVILIEDWTRENFTVTERTSGQQYRFVTPGPNLRAEEWQSCLAKIGSLDPMPDFVVASGSLPPGAPNDFYGRLAKVVSAKQSRFVLDTSGAALAEGLRSGSVYLVKPSMRELRALVGRELVHEREREEGAMEIVKNGQAQVVVVSMGAAGALLVTEKWRQRIPAPAVLVKSKVGAGDSMVAGVVLGLARDMPVAVRFGVACGAAAVMMAGTQLCRRENAEGLFA